MDSLDEIRGLAPDVAYDDGRHAAEPEGGTDREGPDHGDGPGTDVREAGDFGAADVGAAECGSGTGADCGDCVFYPPCG